MKVRSIKTIAEAIFESTKGKHAGDLSDAILNAAVFLKKNHLLGKSKEILAHLEHMIDKDEDIIRAKVTSASVMSKKIMNELEKSLEERYNAKKVEIDQAHNEKVLSGIKIEVGDEIIDLTLARRLHQLQNHLIHN